MKNHIQRLALIVILLSLAASCARTPRLPLMPTPNLYLDPARKPFERVPPRLRTNEATIIYATDRLDVGQKTDEDPRSKPLRYGFGRSVSLAVGTCQVRFGKDPTWDELVRESTSRWRGLSLSTSIVETREAARFAATPYPWNLMKKPNYRQEDYQRDNQKAAAALHELIRNYSPSNKPQDVFVYIHGFNANFYEEACVVAQLWHFLGRRQIPILYTWPAGRGGLTGYTTDSESGEFTIYHLKEFLLTLAESPDVGRINIVSHSRGTDVLSTALRELNQQLACGGDAKSQLKLGQIVMAAPDIDSQVFLQRFVAEEIYDMADGFTFYTSKKDRALALSRWLHGSATRLGLVQHFQVTPQTERVLGYFPELTFVIADVKANFIGHDYFFSNAAVTSDLILLLRERRGPGEANGRPLRKVGNHVWKIEQPYPWKRVDHLQGIYEFGLAPLQAIGRILP